MKRQVKAVIKALRDKVGGIDSKYPYLQHFQYKNIDFKYWITDKIYEGWYNPEGHKDWLETQGYIDLIDKNDRILEVGCNAGFTTSMLCSLTGKDGIIVGMDIIPQNVMISQAQVGLNNFHNCFILNKGAAEKAGKIQVQNTNNGFVLTGSSVGSIEVDVVPCDDLLATYSSFNVLKIDVEGFEGHVLRGAKKILEGRPKLIIELHGAEIPKYNSSIEEIFRDTHIDEYEGVYIKRSENALHKFDRSTYPVHEHATVYLRPRRK